MVAILDENGSITLPRELWESVGFSPGTRVDFTVENGKLIMDRAADDDPVSRARGTIDLGMSTDEFINLLRGKP